MKVLLYVLGAAMILTFGCLAPNAAAQVDPVACGDPPGCYAINTNSWSVGSVECYAYDIASLTDQWSDGATGWYPTILSATVTPAWATLAYIRQPTLSCEGLVVYNIDLSGMAPGTYTYTQVVTLNECGISGQCSPQTTVPLQYTINLTPSFGAFLTDPVPDLVSGNAIKSTAELQEMPKGGSPVSAVAADGVTQVVVKIQTNSPNDQFTVTLFNDQSAQSSLPNEDGALGNPGDTSFSQSEVTVTAGGVDADGVAYAFAVYRAPVDFARMTGDNTYKSGNCNGATNTDDQLACRQVSLQIQDITNGGTPITLPITILRPPVVMVHGLWGSWSDWDNFSPLITGSSSVDPRFSVGRASYDAPISISSSVPNYSASTLYLHQPEENALGFAYNAPAVLNQIEQWIAEFKAGANPVGAQAAAVQADLVAHSMGGDIARTIATLTNFLNDSQNPTFGQGSIHKLITIDTPHLGTPLATKLLSSPESCVQGYLALLGGDYSFSSVTLSDGATPNGAVGDLVGDGEAVDSSLSAALQTIANPGTHPLPTALIVGDYTDFSSVEYNAGAIAAFTACGYNDPLAQTLGLNSSAWPQIFSNDNSDAIVSQTSQLDGLDPNYGLVNQGLVHSPGTEDLGFDGTSVLDAYPENPVPGDVISLLNTPVYLSPGNFFPLNP